ncbi:MAG TPA: hypothetical protein VK841_07380 [Polyangiaceae bacterium]|jgi:hypothetical protein|nr:hypothetical protein [Polyangiaceae bacterium]
MADEQNSGKPSSLLHGPFRPHIENAVRGVQVPEEALAYELNEERAALAYRLASLAENGAATIEESSYDTDGQKKKMRAERAQVAADRARDQWSGTAANALAAESRDASSVRAAKAGEFDGPLVRGGLAALLTVADLSTDESACRMFQRYAQVSGARRPALEELRLARDVLKVLQVGLLTGDADTWRLIKRFGVDIKGQIEARRCAAVDAIAGLQKQVRWDDGDRPGKHHDDDAAKYGPEYHASKAREELAALDGDFAKIELSKLLALVRDGLKPVGIVTKLSILCGAFGDRLSEAERSNTKLAAQEKRIRALYEAAMKKRTRSQKPERAVAAAPYQREVTALPAAQEGSASGETSAEDEDDPAEGPAPDVAPLRT